MFKRTSLVLSLLLCFMWAGAQRVDFKQLRAKSDSLFVAKQYQQALPAYTQLLAQFPRDKEIMYHLGVCYLYATHNHNQAIRYLKEASTGEVPNMVYFHLAEAYRFSYEFEKAIDYYRRYTLNGASNEVKVDKIEILVNLCENGSYITQYVYNPNIIDAQVVALNEVHKYYSLAPKSGSFVEVPDKLLTEVDKKMNHRPVMFYPSDPKAGSYIYYSSYGKTATYGRDIFRTQLLEGNVWSKPESLSDVVNTKFDDDFPYIAPDGITLYFASKGHYGMGGYDIYRTTYDEVTKKWATPENLGFPFNSPFDDFLYVPSEGDTIVAFATSRSTFADSTKVVLIAVNKEQVRRTAESPQQVQEYAALEVATKHQVGATQAPVNNKKQTPQQQQKPAKAASFRAVENDPEYARAIANGFREQMKADSLRTKLEKLRDKFDLVETAEQRVKLEKQVFTVEEAMLNAQRKADQMFVRASQIEQEYLTGKRKPAGKTESTFASDNPNYIYQAQFATTVFQDLELDKLSSAEKLYPAMVKSRDSALKQQQDYADCVNRASNGDTADCASALSAMTVAMEQYSASLAKHFEIKYPIYEECISVAIVKSGSDSDDIRKITSTATTHFRVASTIMNHLADEGRAESEFEASLLRELGLARMDYAFAKVWGMSVMEQKLQQRIAKLDTHIFGSTDIVQKQEKVQPQAQSTPTISSPRIERVEATSTAHHISVKSDIPTDFGVVDTMVYSEANPIPIIKNQPDGVIYRIQIGAFGTPRPPSFFKNMVPISGMRAGQVTKYFIGCLIRYDDAEKALLEVKARGFKDAFIVAWYNGKTVTAQRAKSLENEAPETQKSTSSSDDGRNQQNILYVVQIGVYKGAIPEAELKTVKTLVAGKEISRKTDAQGLFVYSVGSFSTASEAEKIKDNLVASGLQNAIVLTIEL